MKRHLFAILAAGVLWGAMGIYVRVLNAAGLQSGGIAVVRCGIGVLCFAVMLLLTDRNLFRIRLRDLWCFLGTGLCSILFFTFCYYTALTMISMPVAAVLLYTAPTFVMLLSVLLFREKLTRNKILSLVAAFAGCCLVSGLGSGETLSLSGLLYGLGSGIGYALYSIFGRVALNRGYDSRTVSFYSFLFAGLGACLLWGIEEPIAVMTASWHNALWCAALGILCCFLPYLLYTYGLTGVESSRASIMASTEPVVATILGVVVYRERLSVGGILGICLVVAAIVLLNSDFRTQKEKVEKNIDKPKK